jgi:hypothetical protein
MNSSIAHYGMAKHCPFKLVCWNIESFYFKEIRLDLNMQHFEKDWQPMILGVPWRMI